MNKLLKALFGLGLLVMVTGCAHYHHGHHGYGRGDGYYGSGYRPRYYGYSGYRRPYYGPGYDRHHGHGHHHHWDRPYYSRGY